MTPLFRPEALDGQRQSWLGSIQVIRPLSMTLLTAFALGIAALTLAYLFFGEYTRKAHIGGVLVADLSAIGLTPPQAATVLEVRAREGRAVQQRDVLFVLALDRVTPSDGASPAARQRLVIRAPQDGALGAVMVAPGQGVTPTTPLASLTPPEARWQAQLLAPASVIGFLRPQQTVLLRYQAFPYQKFGHQPGQVLHVSRTPLSASELAGLSLSHSAPGMTAAEPLYRVTVALDPQAVSANSQTLPLAAGMQLEADVLLDRRRLIEWLFEPVLGLAGRV